MRRIIAAIFIILFLATNVAVMAQEQSPPCVAQWTVGGGPMDAVADANRNVYVTLGFTTRVSKFDEFGALLQHWDGYVNNPRGVTVDSQGFVYVGSWGDGYVYKFDGEGNLVHSWDGIGAMYVTAESGDEIWLTSFGGNAVRMFDTNGLFQHDWAASNPRGIDVDFNGDVYVSEQGAWKVNKYDSLGNHLLQVGSDFAWDVAVDDMGNVYLAETTRVVKYDSAGNYLTEWAGCETGTGGFANLRGISIGRDKYIYVSDYGSGRVSVFGPVAPVTECVGFKPPMANYPVTVKKSRALPLKAEVFDEAGIALTYSDLTAPPVVQVWFDSGEDGDAVDVTDDVLSVGQGDEGNQFVFTEDAKWQFNLSTKNYTSPGTYTVLMETGDNSEYVFEPTCMTEFVIK